MHDTKTMDVAEAEEEGTLFNVIGTEVDDRYMDELKKLASLIRNAITEYGERPEDRLHTTSRNR